MRALRGKPLDERRCIRRQKRRTPREPRPLRANPYPVNNPFLHPLALRRLLPRLPVHAEHRMLRMREAAVLAANVQHNRFARPNSIDAHIPPIRPALVGIRLRLEVNGPCLLIDGLDPRASPVKIACDAQFMFGTPHRGRKDAEKNKTDEHEGAEKPVRDAPDFAPKSLPLDGGG